MALARSRSGAAAVSLVVGLALSACQGGSRSDQDTAKPVASCPAPTDTFYDGFEQPADNGWKPGINAADDDRRRQPVSQLEQQPDGPLGLVASPVRDGGHALRATVPHALGSFRSEVACGTVPMGSENWYGFSIYLPPNWQTDPQDTVLAQWHALIGQDAKDQDAKGQDAKDQDDEVRNNPPVALSVQGDQWMLKLHWNTQGAASTGPGSGRRDFPLGTARTGVWNDFVLHATWSPTGNGVVQLWQGGELAVDYTGPDEYRNDQGPYFKIGIYHPGWKTKNADQFAADTAATGAITVYDDAVRLAAGSATYQDVAPERH